MSIAVGFHNGFGNFVMFTPALQIIRGLNGGAVDLFVDEEWDDVGLRKIIVDLAGSHESVSRVLNYPSEYDVGRYDRHFMSFHSFPDRLFRAFSPIAGIAFDRLDHQWAYGDLLHEIEFYVREVRSDFGYSGPIPDQVLTAVETPLKTEIFCSLPKAAFIVVLSNGYLRTNSGAWDRKAFPHWNELLSTFIRYYGPGKDDVRFLLLGGADDREWGRTIDSFDGRVVDLTGKTGIVDSVSIVASCHYVITTDTGIMHVADALRKPGIVLFGSTLVSKNGPWNKTLYPVTSPMKCAPCQGTVIYELCEHPEECMKSLKISSIISAIRKDLAILPILAKF